ncbi:MAG: hypothetical protein ACYC0Z_14900 [Acidobacteriaceae bacterium]
MAKNQISADVEFQGLISQTPGQGTNNSSPFAQYADLFSDAIVTTPTPAFPTSTTLSSTAPALDAYVLGQRVVYAGGSYTVGASATSYLDLSNTGVLTVSTSATVTADSLRLATVTSSATAITAIDMVALPSPAAKSTVSFIGTNGSPNGGPTIPLTLATSTTGGTIAASTTYFYLVTPVYADGPDFMPNSNAPGSGVATGSATATNSNTISWAAVSGAVSYNVCRASSNSAVDFTIIGTTTGLTFTDTGLAAGAAAVGVESTAFAAVPLSSISVDTAGGWSAADQAYKIPVSGVWEVVTLLAYADTQPNGTSYACDSNSSVADSPYDIWGMTPTPASGQIQRNGLLNTKKQHFNAGDMVQIITYAGAPMCLKACISSLTFVGG